MPRYVSVATAIEKNRITSEVAFVPLLEIMVSDPRTGAAVETLRFARNSEDIAFNGFTWIASAFDFDLKTEAGTAPSLTVTVHDYTRAIQARMQAYGGGVGFGVNVYIVNSANLAQPPEVFETFRVTGARAQNYDAVFTLGTENPLTMAFPRRAQWRDRCQWRYKGAECGYVGGLPTCDFSLEGANGCKVHQNSLRFGGFPGINSAS